MGTVRPQIVVFGDSLTEWGNIVAEGWTTSLSAYYNRKADVILRGYAGYNTRLARLILDKIFPLPSSNPPLLVTVFFGANDAADPKAGHGMAHVPLQEYTENLHEIVAHIKKLSDSTKIILIAPPPICEEKLVKSAVTLYADTSGVPTRRNEVTKLYAQECVKVGQETNVPVIDLWTIFQETPDWKETYLSDGLHFTAEGNSKVFKELVTVLDGPDFDPRLKVEQMSWDFPQWYNFGEDPVLTVKTWCSQSNL